MKQSRIARAGDLPVQRIGERGIHHIVSKVEHKEPNVSIFTTITGVDGDQAFEAKYTTDGKETTVKLPFGSVKATAKWEGDALAVEGKAEEFNVKRASNRVGQGR